MSQSCQWAHQIHRSRAVLLLYTGHRHARNLFVRELVVPFPVDCEGAWLSSDQHGSQERNSPELNVCELYKQFRHDIDMAIETYTLKRIKGYKTMTLIIVGTTFVQYAVHHPIRTVHEKSTKVVS